MNWCLRFNLINNSLIWKDQLASIPTANNNNKINHVFYMSINSGTSKTTNYHHKIYYKIKNLSIICLLVDTNDFGNFRFCYKIFMK